jgi:hypothetical protein
MNHRQKHSVTRTCVSTSYSGMGPRAPSHLKLRGRLDLILLGCPGCPRLPPMIRD